MSAEEPASKKQKTEDWANHKLNIENAVVKAEEGKRFSELVDSSIQVLQGIGPVHDQILESLNITTVKDMATYKFYLAAKAVKTLSAVEGSFRPEGSPMNVDNLVDQDYETKSFMELLEAPIAALQGLTEKAEKTLSGMGVKTIGDLASCKYFTWAEAICEVAKFEEQKTKAERHLEREQKKLGDYLSK